jgi:transcriptional regulator with XRE-family HTH domain
VTEKRLDLDRIGQAMTERGLNAAAIAGELGVSKTIVSEWLRGKKFPRPAALLKLGRLLGLKYAELIVQVASVREPIVAYRKHGNTKLTKADMEKAVDFGRAVSLLVPYLPFPRLEGPSRFIDPSLDSAYIEDAAAETRRSLGTIEARVEFSEIIQLFANLKTVLVPVLWGEKGGSANGLHVYLPDSQTTFVYLNLDSKIFDFKFWMLHELGHAKTFGALSQEDAERFADAFASAVLVPKTLAKSCYREISGIANVGARINSVLDAARRLVVSPITIAKRIDEIAFSRGDEPPFGSAIFPATVNFNKEYGLVSEELFPQGEPEASALIQASDTVFKSPIYHALHGYVAEHGSSEGIVAACLGIGPADAKAVFGALTA